MSIYIYYIPKLQITIPKTNNYIKQFFQVAWYCPWRFDGIDALGMLHIFKIFLHPVGITPSVHLHVSTALAGNNIKFQNRTKGVKFTLELGTVQQRLGNLANPHGVAEYSHMFWLSVSFEHFGIFQCNLGSIFIC